MKLTVIALALAATTFAANAQTTIITEERAPSAVIVAPEPSVSTTVTTKEHGGLLGTELKTTTTTTGSGSLGDCSTRTVHKEGLVGEKTVTKTNCP